MLTSEFAHIRLLKSSRSTLAAMTLLLGGTLISCDTSAPQAEGDTDENAAALSTPGETDLVRTLKAIDVSPASSTLLVDLGKSGTRTFKVVARYNDRSTADVSALATYSVDATSVGTMTGPSFTSATRSTAQVDFATVTVRYREGGVEITARVNLTVAWLRTSGPSPDVLLTLPYMGSTLAKTINFGSSPQSIDAFLAVDTTGSMGGEINEINRSLGSTIMPGIRAVVTDSNFGVGAVEDFPNGAFGSPSCYGDPSDDQPFILLSAMSNDLMAVQTAFSKLLRGSSPRGCGADTPEGQMEALYQIATGVGNVVSGVVNIPSHRGTGRGGVEFRPGALPIVSMITDAAFHTVGEPTKKCLGTAVDYTGSVATAAHGRAATTTALQNLCARVVGVSVELGTEAGCMAHADMIQFATATGARVQPEAWDAGTRPGGCASGECCTGLGGVGEAADVDGLCPLVMKGKSDGSGIGAQVVSGITQLVRFAPSDVNLQKTGGATAQDGTPLPMGKSTADFVTSITAIDGMAPATPSGLMSPTASGDHFTGVVPGSSLRFAIEAKNSFIPAGTKPQVFKASLTTQASACATLDARTLLIVVPAT